MTDIRALWKFLKRQEIQSSVQISIKISFIPSSYPEGNILMLYLLAALSL
jgi:hypothetical protein